MPLLKYKDPNDGLWKPVPVGSTSPNEVAISDTAPSDPAVELWFDTTTETLMYRDPYDGVFKVVSSPSVPPEPVASDTGSWCRMSGTYPGITPIGDFDVNLTTIWDQRSRLPYSISGGCIMAPYTGAYSITLGVKIEGGQSGQLRGGHPSWVTKIQHYSANEFYAGELYMTAVASYNAGALLPRPHGFSNTTMSSAVGYMWATYLGAII